MTGGPTPVFSLDIGTRKVIGLLTTPTPRGGLKIIAAERLEHTSRSMYDGQVHDVPAVADVVARIKERLEQRTGIQLREAAVAAAGRALRTAVGRVERQREALDPITHEEAFTLELEAVQEAQAALADSLRSQGEARDYLFMGHSVLSRRLDGLEFRSLTGQRGARVQVEVIATFLPRAVVDSLLSVLERVGLEMAALTLEPIAAINVVIPPSMRHLNLALVDVGAGTSDIAITRQGTVVAYDMVPVAGDEITEALSHAYLLDFPVAEAVKRQLNGSETVQLSDVLGRKRTVPAAEVIAALAPAVRDLARQLAERILTLNGGPPQAVVLIGGGSQTPGLAPAVAEALGLEPDRVAVRGRDAIQGVTGAGKLLSGPEAVTPVGIAVAAHSPGMLGFAYVYVNGVGVRLFHPNRLQVADALLAAGFRMSDLLPRLGEGLTVLVNGQLRLVPGTRGKPARILLNGEPATLETPVRHRDRVEVEPAVPGARGRARVVDLLPELTPLPVVVNGEPVTLMPPVWVNGQPADPNRELEDNDRVEARPIRTLADALACLPNPPAPAEVVIRVRQGETEHTIRRPGFVVTVDGQPATPDTPVRPGALITLVPAPAPTAAEVAAAVRRAQAPAAGGVEVQFNGRPVRLTPPVRLLVNGEEAGPDTPLRDGDVLTMVASPDRTPILADLLAAVDFAATPPPAGGFLRLRVNGQPAAFNTPLAPGDQVEAGWEPRP